MEDWILKLKSNWEVFWKINIEFNVWNIILLKWNIEKVSRHPTEILSEKNVIINIDIQKEEVLMLKE